MRLLEQRLCLLAGCFLLAGVSVTGAQAQAPLDGAVQFRNQCGTCHTLDPNAPARQGPMLRGVVGRAAGTVQGFKYSLHLQNAGFAWTEEKLDAYLTNPQAVVEGGMMPYRQAKGDVRRAVIAYLKDQN